LEQLDPDGNGVTKNKLREKAHLSGARVNAGIEGLIDEGTIEVFEGQAEVGSNAKRKAELIRHLKHQNKDEREV
jgi:hypothetical protein